MAVCLIWVLCAGDHEVSVIRRLWPTTGYCTGGGGWVAIYFLKKFAYIKQFFMADILCSCMFCIILLSNTMLSHCVAPIKQIPSLGTWVAQLFSILGQMNPLFILPPYFFKIHGIINLPFTLGIASCFVTSGFPPKYIHISLFISLCTHCMLHPSKPTLFCYPFKIWWEVQIVEVLIVQCFSSPFLCYAHSHWSKYLISNLLTVLHLTWIWETVFRTPST